MHAFDEVLDWLRGIERKSAFKGKNDVPFTSLVALDMRVYGHRYLKKYTKKNKVQSVLVNRKPKASTFMKESGNVRDQKGEQMERNVWTNIWRD